MTPILDSRKLLAFVTLAEAGSFTRAARELSRTQSAVSHSIKSLEQELGCRLFDRLGRRVKLTHSGEQLFARAGKILAEMRSVRAEFAGPPQQPAQSSATIFLNHPTATNRLSRIPDSTSL